MGQAFGQFDVGVGAVIQAVRSLWPDLDIAQLEEALTHPTPNRQEWPMSIRILHLARGSLKRASQV